MKKVFFVKIYVYYFIFKKSLVFSKIIILRTAKLYFFDFREIHGLMTEYITI